MNVSETTQTTTTTTTDVSIVAQIIAQTTAIAVIESKVSYIHSRLFGNGQPGILDKIDDRLSDGEKFTFMVKGALMIIGILVSLLTGTEVLRFTGHL